MQQVEPSYKERGGLFGASLASLFVIVCAYFLNYFINQTLAHWLGASVYGDFSAAVNAFKVFGVLVLFGIDYAVVRFLPEYLSVPDWAKASGFLHLSLGVLGRMAAYVLVLGLGADVVFYLLNSNQVLTFEEHHPVYLFLWAVPFVALNTFFGKLLRSTHHVFWSLFSLNVAQPIVFLLTLLVVFALGHRFDIHEALLAYALSTALVLLLQVLSTFAKLPKQALRTAPQFESGLWSRVALQLMITGFLSSNLNSMSVIVSELFDPNEANPGVLSAIFTLCSSMWLAYSAVTMVMSPLISPAVYRKDKARLQALINMGNLTMVVVALALLVVLLFWGEAILGHFGTSFVRGWDALMLIAVVFAFALANGMSLPILQYSGHQNKLVWLTFAGTIFVLTAGGVLSHWFGLMGSAAAVCAVQLALSLWSSYQVRRIFGVRPYILF